MMVPVERGGDDWVEERESVGVYGGGGSRGWGFRVMVAVG